MLIPGYCFRRHYHEKWLLLILVLSIALALSACGAGSQAAPGIGSSAASPTSEPDGQPGPGPLAQILPLSAERFDYAEEFHNGYAFVIRGEDCGYIDAGGNFTAYYKSGALAPEALENYHFLQLYDVSEEGLFPLYDETSGLWGYGDIATGQMVIHPQYTGAFPFAEGRAVTFRVVTSADESDLDISGTQVVGSNAVGVWQEFWIIDAQGSDVFQVEEPFATRFIDGYLYAMGPGEAGACLYDHSGQVRTAMPTTYEIFGGLYSALMEPMGGELLQGDPEHLGIVARDGENGDTPYPEVKEIYYINSAG